jgi:translation initiation factor 2B subunit (eIF-2B alpha/beta/delta family)
MREEDPEASFEVIVVDSRPLNEGLPTYLLFVGVDTDIHL